MGKYLYIGSYTAQGAKGVMQQGGSARRKAAKEIVESIGGTLESYYFGFGKDDFYVTFDAPSHAAAAALALTVGGSGAISGRTVALITPEEMDAAARMTPHYSPPGS
jgi:uncharacterized protein with GYD domain